MKHLIIGNGNLGKDLELALSARGEEVTMRPRDWVYTLAEQRFDIVWCTAGKGGPTDCMGTFVKQIEAHVLLTAELINRAPKETRLVFFSTHYLNEDPKGDLSRYAMTKRMLEDLAQSAPNAVVYRVGSLYAEHRPERTFPGKLIPKLLQGERVLLPENRVAPTSTSWLAQKLMETELRPERLKGKNFIIGPSGSTSVREWGARIALQTLGSDDLIGSRGFDVSYPKDSMIGFMNECEDWTEIWRKSGCELCSQIIRRSVL
jgi:dTDP-4-dehydrorhamnose reductase